MNICTFALSLGGGDSRGLVVPYFITKKNDNKRGDYRIGGTANPGD